MWYDYVWVKVRVCEGERVCGTLGCMWCNWVRARMCGGVRVRVWCEGVGICVVWMWMV